MGVMRVIYKIMPTEPGEEIIKTIIDKVSKLSSELNVKLHDYKLEPIAFGLYSLKVLVSMREEEDEVLNRFEDKVKNINEVESLEVVGMTRA